MRRTRRPARGNGDWGYINDGKTVSSPTTGKSMEDGRVPKHLCCCINGHLMRDPVFFEVPLKYRCSYERETIELWLKTRGSVCPIAGRNLSLEDLEPDTQLRNEIVRFQVQRTMAAADPLMLSTRTRVGRLRLAPLLSARRYIVAVLAH